MKCYQFDKAGHWMSTVERDVCPADATTVRPDCEYPKWDGKKWIVDEVLVAEAEEQLYEAAIKVKEAEILRRQAIAELEAEK